MFTLDAVKWLPIHTFPLHLIPQAIQPWLADKGSMTKALKKNCQRLSVALLSQHHQKPDLSESLYLGLHPSNVALIREVYLKCDDQIVSYGRSIFPLSFFRGKNRAFLAQLGKRPLGELLFKYHTVMRTQIQVAKLFPHQKEHQQTIAHLTHTIPALWGRRSLLQGPEGRILVMDVLFPELEKYHV